MRAQQQQNTSTPAAIVATSAWFLAHEEMQGRNFGFDFFAFHPSLPGAKYATGASWLWDSGAQMIAVARQNVTKATLALRTMLQFQSKEGFIPEEIYWGPLTLAQRAAIELQYGDLEKTPISQMPLLAFTLRAMVNASRTPAQQTALIGEFLEPLVAYQDWWLRTRDPFGCGLAAIVHGWESGLDASPAYDEAYGVPPQPTYFQLYPKFVELTIAYHAEFDWDLARIVNRNNATTGGWMPNYFIVYDAAINSVLAGGYRILAQLAASIGDAATAAHCQRAQARIEHAILTRMWMSAENRFAAALYANKGQLHFARAETAQSLFPLLLESLPAAQLRSIVVSQLTNTSRFWLNYPIPSTSAADAAFQPDFGKQGDLMWRGPTWPILTWFVLDGLALHQQTAVAAQLFGRWLALVSKTGIFEQYQPITGAPFGPAGLSMSNLITDAICQFLPQTQGCVNP